MGFFRHLIGVVVTRSDHDPDPIPFSDLYVGVTKEVLVDEFKINVLFIVFVHDLDVVSIILALSLILHL